MWSTETTDEFDIWFAGLGEEEQVEVAAKIDLLKIMGPQLKRPHADTLNGSAYANMKELRAKIRCRRRSFSSVAANLASARNDSTSS